MVAIRGMVHTNIILYTHTNINMYMQYKSVLMYAYMYGVTYTMNMYIYTYVQNTYILQRYETKKNWVEDLPGKEKII